MAYYYFDASALVKYYIREPGYTWVRECVDAQLPGSVARRHTVFMADMSTAETAAAFAILHRTARIGKRLWDASFDQFMGDIGSRFSLVGTQRDDYFIAAYLTKRHPLKAYDAVQLAVALRQQRAMAAYRLALTFVSGDGRLLDAARAEGLPVENPFDHVAPEDTAPRR
jgi:predicted nucleic acid-binding protein